MPYPEMSTSVPWSIVRGGFRKTPSFKSFGNTTMTGRRSAIAMKPYPTWDFTVDLAGVQGREAAEGILQSFLGTYMASCGAGGYFIFTDPDDNTVSNVEAALLNVSPGAAEPMGQKGDGVSTRFQLARNIDQGVDILQNIVGYAVTVDGNAVPGTMDAKGIFTFDAAPADGALLAWEGQFQYLCAFKDDTLQNLARVTKNAIGYVWECSSVSFGSVFV